MGVGAVLGVMVAGVVWMAGAAGMVGMGVGRVELEGGVEGGVIASSLGAPTR